jgi:hypothetical protein
MNRVEDFSHDRKLQGKVLDAEHEQATKRLERGAMGWLLGIGKEKPGNVVGFAIIISCLMVIAIGLLPFHGDVPRKELVMLIATIIPAAIGYYFGYLAGTKFE